MKYSEFEDVISPERMRRYVSACANDTKRAMTLYRYNIKLSQEMYAIISCFEVALRNKINKEMKAHFGNDWLRDFVMPGGRFDTDPRVEGTRKIIQKAYEGLVRCHSYNHTKLLAEMEFGVWKFLFNNVQYRLSGRCLLNIFPNKPTSTPWFQYDNAFVFYPSYRSLVWFFFSLIRLITQANNAQRAKKATTPTTQTRIKLLTIVIN